MLSATRGGFTIVELIVTLAIFVLLVAAATPAYTTFFVKYQLVTKASDLRELLRTAQGLSMANLGDDTYGVHYATGTGTTYVLFKGASYASRDLSYDELSTTLPNSVSLTSTVSGSDVVFTKVEGSTGDEGTITLTSSGGDVRTITVNAAGTVDLQ